MGNLRELVPIGAHWCLWTPDGGSEIDLGFTEDGVELDVDSSWYRRSVHESAVIFDKRLDERTLVGEIILKEVDPDRVAAALGGLKTIVAGPPEKEAIDISPVKGEMASFGKLVFRPRTLTGLGGTDLSQDKTIFNAMVDATTNRIFKANADGTIRFGFEGGLYWDSVAGKFKFYCEGDPTAYTGFDL